MSLTSRKRRPVDRRRGQHRDSSLIVIATEGTETEKQYFECFKGARLQVRVLPTKEGRSAPRWVLDRLDEYRKEYQIASRDELWLVIDRDDWEERDLSDVATECQKKGYELAVSNPCFELWLLLHLDDIDLPTTCSCGEVTAMLKRKLGTYNKKRIRPASFERGIEDAITRAEALDLHPGDRWPSSTGTRVYRLVRTLRSRCRFVEPTG